MNEKDNRVEAIIAQVAKKQIEQKYGSVANAITQMCNSRPEPPQDALLPSGTPYGEQSEFTKSVREKLNYKFGDEQSMPSEILLEQACDIIDRQHQRIGELEEKERGVICIWCGQSTIYEPPLDLEKLQKIYEDMKKHDLTCSQNPLVIENKNLHAKIVELEGKQESEDANKD